MIFPASAADLARGGYVFLSTRGCSRCGELLHFYRSPRGRVCPFLKTPRSRFVSHFVRCPGSRRHQERESPQLELFSGGKK